jgi:hypothetical protein
MRPATGIFEMTYALTIIYPERASNEREGVEGNSTDDPEFDVGGELIRMFTFAHQKHFQSWFARQP